MCGKKKGVNEVSTLRMKGEIVEDWRETGRERERESV